MRPRQLRNVVWDPLSVMIARRLNRICSWVPPPPLRLRDDVPPHKVLLVHAHPSPTRSLSRLLADTAEAAMTEEAGVEVRRLELRSPDGPEAAARGDGHVFEPRLSREEWEQYLRMVEEHTIPSDLQPHVDALQWADALVFSFPTWWFGMPATLKGWFDRVLLPGVAFQLDDAGQLHGTLQNIRKIGVLTSYGTPMWPVLAGGDPTRTFFSVYMRGLCHPSCTLSWHALYDVDAATEADVERLRQSVHGAYEMF